MRPFYASSLLFLFFFLSSHSSLSSYTSTLAPTPAPAPSPSHSHSHSHHGSVQKACRMAWEHTAEYRACVATLLSLPGSRNATLRSLAALSLGLAVRDLRAIVKRVQELELRSHGTGGAAYQESLSQCESETRKAMANMEECMREVREARYGAATLHLHTAAAEFVCDGVRDDAVAKKREDVIVLHQVALTLSYKYCRKFAKHDPDCVF